METNASGVVIQNRRLPQAATVVLRRVSDSYICKISAPCILKLPSGLVHVIGQPQEELDTQIWDVTENFAVVEIQREPAHYTYKG